VGGVAVGEPGEAGPCRGSRLDRDAGAAGEGPGTPVPALADAAGPDRIRLAREGTAHPGWRVRRSSCRLLGEGPIDDLTRSRLVAVARGDAHRKVRAQALAALVVDSYATHAPARRAGPPGGGRYDVVGLLLERLRQDRSLAVRRAAAAGLHLQVVVNAIRERRVRRGLARALGTGDDEARRRLATSALDALAGVPPTDPYAGLAWALDRGRADVALRLVRVHMRVWEVRGEFVEARRWIDRVLAASRTQPPTLLAPVLHDAGYAALATGDFDAAAGHLRASVDAWRRGGQRLGALRTRCLMAFLGSVDDAAAVGELEADIEVLRGAGGHPALVVEALVAAGHARLFRGSPQLARTHLEEALALADRDGVAVGVAGLLGLGCVELAQGAYPAAEARLEEVLARATADADRYTEVIGRCWQAELARLRGDPGEARRRAQACVGEARAMGAPTPLALALVASARALLESGEASAARSRFEEAEAVASGGRLHHLVLAARLGQAEAALARGEVELAGGLLERGLAEARRRGDALGTAAASHHLGRVARHRGDLVAAAALHDEALAAREVAGDRAGVADSLEAVAGLAVVRGSHVKAARLHGAAESVRHGLGGGGARRHDPGTERDLERLRAGLDARELELAWAEGAALPLGEAVWQARRGRGRRGRPRRGWEALTPAQRRVAHLVIDGLTNAEVADRLFVGSETVKSHLAVVFAKLGLRSRRELVRAGRPAGGDQPSPEAIPWAGDVPGTEGP